MLEDTALLTLVCGPSLLFVVTAVVTTAASLYCCYTLRTLVRRTSYALGENSGRITHLERALDAERERLMSLRRIIMRPQPPRGVSDETDPAAPSYPFKYRR